MADISGYSVSSSPDFTLKIGDKVYYVVSPASTGVIQYYGMRAVSAPPGSYVQWEVDTTPDFTGTYAPVAITAGTAIVVYQRQE